MSRKPQREYGPSEGQRMMRGLAEAAKQIAAEDRIKQVQLKLFDNLKSEGQKVQ